MRQLINRKFHLALFAFLAVVAFAYYLGRTSAFTGPSANPPSGSGGIVYSGGNVGIGAAVPLAALDVNGVGAHGLGTVGAPSFAIRTDLDTGMWSSGANTLNFSTGGSEAMRITSGQNVGINMTPAFRLDVTDTGTAPQLRLTGQTAGVNNGAQIQLVTTGRTWDIGTGYGTGTTDLAVRDITASINRLTIDSAGVITTSASTTVAGNIRVSGANADMGVHPTYGSTYAAWWKDGGDYALLTNNTDTFVNVNGASGVMYFRRQNGDLMTLTGTTLSVGGGAGKINIGTVDPIYTIGGVRYATYGGEGIGIKVQHSDNLQLVCDSGKKICEGVLDLGNALAGSDLWLFAKTTDLFNNFRKLSVQLTPAFDGSVWYEKDGVSGRVTVYGRPSDYKNSPLEVSYLLFAPRFDSAKWTNLSSGSDEGFVLP